jgi:hypothetical protein
MLPQELLEWPARKLLQSQLELMHAEQEQAQSGQQAPCIDVCGHWITSVTY